MSTITSRLTLKDRRVLALEPEKSEKPNMFNLGGTKGKTKDRKRKFRRVAAVENSKIMSVSLLEKQSNNIKRSDSQSCGITEQDLTRKKIV